MFRVFGQVTRQAFHGLLAFGSVVGGQGGANVLADAEPPIRQKRLSALVQPRLGFGSSFAEESFGRVRNVRAGMVNIQQTQRSGKLHLGMIPDPLCAVAENRDRSERLDAQALHPGPPLRCEGVDAFDGGEGVPHAGLGEITGVPLLGRGRFPERTLRENGDFHVAPAGVGVDFDAIGLKLDDARGLGKGFGGGRIFHLPFSDAAGFFMASLTQAFVADLPTA